MNELHAFGAAVILLAELAAAAFVGWRVSGSAVEAEGSVPLRTVTGAVVGMTQIIAVQMLCAALDVLYLPVVLGLHLGIAIWVWKRVRPVTRPRSWVKQTGLAWVSLWTVIAFAGILGVLMSAKVPTDPDSLQYHIPNAASWLQLHNLWHLPATNPGYFTNGYPSDGELVTSLFMQPLHQAQWSAWPSLLYGAAILAGSALLSEELGAPPRYGLLAATAILLSPISWGTQIGGALTDWTSLSGLVMAVALVLHAKKHSERRWFLLAGLALGIAVGSKDTALLPTVILFGLAAVILPRGWRFRGNLLILLGLVALAGIWFLRDAIQAGNPLYPEPIRIAGTTVFRGGTGPVTAWSTSILKDFLTGNGHALKIWLQTFEVWVGPAIVVSAGAALSLTRWHRRDLRSLLAGITAIWFLLYMATPYTGPSSFPLLIGAQVRYALPAMALAAVCACVESGVFRFVAWIAIGYDLWGIVHGVHLASVPARMRTPREALVLVALVGALAIAVLLSRAGATRVRVLTESAPRAAVPAALVVVALVSCLVLSTAAVRHSPTPSKLDLALAAGGRPQGPVMIDGDGDVLSAMGNKLQHRVVSAGGGGAPHQVPLSTAALLNDRVRTVDPAAVIIGPANWPGVINGWTPRGYRLLYIESGRRIFIKDSVYAELSGSYRPQP